jgi:hypothetical protein
MLTAREAVTALVVTAKLAPVAPAAMVTAAGSAASARSLLERETTAPPLGAGALSATLPVEGDPPVTLPGFSVSEVRVGPGAGRGVTMRDAVGCWVTPVCDAVMLTVVVLGTAWVVTWKVATALPAATVTLAGTVATEVLLLKREMTVPPLGAGPLSVTSPVEGLPPLTLVGFSVIKDRVEELGDTVVPL